MDIQEEFDMTSFEEVLCRFAESFSEYWDIKMCISTTLTYLAAFFGDDWWLISTLFILLASDTVLGMASALKTTHALSARKLSDGMLKFMAYGAAIVLVWLTQQVCLHVVPFEIPVLAFFAGYQCLTEISSVSRHLKRLGFPIPKLMDSIMSTATESVGKNIEKAQAKLLM